MQIPSYSEFLKIINKLKINYPNLLDYQTIGFSIFHRPIIMLQLGHGRERHLFTGGVHARESVNPVVLLTMVEHYLEHWHEYSNYFDTHTLLIIPLLNPDGYEYRKHVPDWKENGRGVDINRNFPSLTWKSKHPGDFYESEPETHALINVLNTTSPSIYIDFHSRGECIFYHRQTMDSVYNARQYALAKKIQAVTGYELVPPEEEIDPNDSGGNTVHYASEYLHIPAITVETVVNEAPFPLVPEYIEQVFKQIYKIPFSL